MECTTLQKIAFCTLTAGVLVASQSVLAHSRLQTPVAVEGITVYNNMAIGHGCESTGAWKARVIANSVVFPDGTDSTVSINGVVVPNAKVDDYIGWGGKIAHIYSNDAFKKTHIERGRAGIEGANPVGNHSWNGDLPGDNVVGLVPIRISAVLFKTAAENPNSCAKSVTFRVADADICKITDESGFNNDTVNLWTPAVGSKFDGVPGMDGYNSPATYKITRDLDPDSPNYNPLPAGCGEGVDVVVNPSAAQLDHDMPIRDYDLPNPRIWPLN